MNKYILIIISFLLCVGINDSIAQKDSVAQKDKPVRPPFESGILIDDQTVFVPVKNTLEFIIEHRFGEIDNLGDLYGIYAASNIRLGVNYSLRDNLMIGFGTTKDNKLQDFRLKYVLFQQTRKNSIPVSVAFYGNMAIDARNKDVFGAEYAFSNRLSYFAQLIISRKINHAVSLQLAPAFSHINSVHKGYEHDKVSISFSGRARISPQSSIIICYDQPIEFSGLYENTDPVLKPKPNLAIGWEISTSTHAFQLFIASSRALVPQYNMLYNTNDWTEGDFFFGFNITRLWSF